jgi:outer membrane protein OmpA-like peptidoglycan-associated protein
LKRGAPQGSSSHELEITVTKILKTALVAAMSAATLGGCAATWDIDGVAAQKASGSAFTQALHKNYVERARFEEGEADWASVAFFVERARMAANGQAPALLSPGDWGVTAADLTAEHDRLAAALSSNAPTLAPDACARAQAWYEHWVEQRREGHQPDDIATAKAGYDAAVVDCVPGAPPKAEAPPPAPAKAEVERFLVHFPFDSSSLVGEAMSVINRVVSFFKDHDMSAVEVVGHTDTAGPDAYNARLSERRAAAVKGALLKGGVPAAAVSTAGEGETAPVVDSGDGVAEGRNRRAEIIVKP